MSDDCESQRIIKQAIHRLEIDKGDGVFNYAAVLSILRGNDECSCTVAA